MKISWLHLTLLLLALCVLCTHCGREDREHRNRNRNRNRNRDREHRRHRRMERRFRRLRLRGHRRALPDPTTTTTTTTPLPTTTTEAIMNRPDAFQVVSRRMRYPSNDPRSAVVEYGKLGTAGNRDGNYETQLRNFLRTMQTSSSARTETEAPETEAPETEVQTSSEADVDEDHGAGTEEYDDYLWEARWRKRERARQARLFMIQNQILRKLGMRRQPNITYQALSREQKEHIIEHYQENFRRTDTQQDYYAKRFKSYGPSCDLPRRSDRNWRNPQKTRLYFVLDPPETPSTQLSASTLHVYKRAIPMSTQSSDDLTNLSTNRVQLNATTVGEMTDEHVLVKVYRYLRPIRRRKAESRELVTSLIVRGDFEGWLEFNIHDGVRRWYGGKRNRTRNFGMVLEVEDKDGRTLNSPSIFTGSNCNSTTNSNTFIIPPLLAMDENENGTGTSNGSFPYLDVLTVDNNRRESESGHQQSPNENRNRREASSISCDFVPVTINSRDVYPILHPMIIHTGYCGGSSCPHDGMFCQPAQPKKLPILYEDADRKIKYSELADLGVSACECSLQHQETHNFRSRADIVQHIRNHLQQ